MTLQRTSRYALQHRRNGQLHTGCAVTCATTGMPRMASAVACSCAPSFAPVAAVLARTVPWRSAWDVLATSSRLRAPAGLQNRSSRVLGNAHVLAARHERMKGGTYHLSSRAAVARASSWACPSCSTSESFTSGENNAAVSVSHTCTRHAGYHNQHCQPLEGL